MLVGLTLLSHVDLGLQTRSLTAAGGALTAVLHAVYNSHTHTRFILELYLQDVSLAHGGFLLNWDIEDRSNNYATTS